MRAFLLLFAISALVLFAFAAQAQSIGDNIPQTVPFNQEDAPPPAAPQPQADIYTITDVNADVTADTAAHARDQALMQAERSAFTQLCSKMNVPEGAIKIDDDSLSELVQSFEVQSERLSAVRYIGVFTIRFKPIATQKKLGKYTTASTDANGNPVGAEASKVPPSGPMTHISVAVQTESLASWTQIKKRLNAAPPVAQINMVDLGRGLSHIDLSFTGSVGDLQQALTAQGLILRQNNIGIWELYDGSMVPR